MVLIPYTRHQITPEDETAVTRALRSGYLAQGPEVEALEAELCAVTGARFAVVVGSGTAALELLYLVLQWPIVDCPCITFLATANAARRAGSTVRFTDCDPTTGLVAAADAMVAVTLGGQPPARSFAVVDACHGPLRHLGRIATVLSFHPAKHVAAGEGGAILTNLASYATECRARRDAGRGADKRQVTLGTNARMDEMSAALARSQLQRYHEGVTARRAIAARYDDAFDGVVERVEHTPESARHLYQVLVDDQTGFRARLAERDVGSQVHYRPVPSEPYWGLPGWRDRFPGAARYSDRTVSIPLYPSMTDQDVETVIRAVRESA